MHMQQNDIQNPEIQVYMKPLNVESRCNWMNMAAEALKCEKNENEWEMNKKEIELEKASHPLKEWQGDRKEEREG